MKGTSQQSLTKINIFNFVLLHKGPNEKKIRGTIPLDCKPQDTQKNGVGGGRMGLKQSTGRTVFTRRLGKNVKVHYSRVAFLLNGGHM
jgi:hypothetical protein